MPKTRKSRHEAVSALLEEYFALTGKTYPYPRRNSELATLQETVAQLVIEKRKELFHDVLEEIKRPRTRKKEPDIDVVSDDSNNLTLTRSALNDHDRIYHWVPSDAVSSSLRGILQQIVKENPRIN
ncbi:hypothetical protein ACJMK2_008502 [Sinanodonta woodiana]|uniref:Uncharacterized protein n=1 Tax=Sinanodonta woodiana TaxID=1069815 RepID=A0ABD3VM14_SINWO